MSRTIPLRDQRTMQDLADVVAVGSCVWFAGAGLSLEADMPTVTKLTFELLDNAFVRRIGPWSEAELQGLWEEIKRRLIGTNYERASGNLLHVCDSLLAVEEEIERCKEEIERCKEENVQWPLWLQQLLNLGRVSETLHFHVHERQEADVALAQLMGFETEQGGAAPLWDKPPGFTHHLLALLIKEGRITTFFTTNYDELVEKACEAVDASLLVVANRSDLYEASIRVDRPSTTYYKIHGCRGWYRRALGKPEELHEACKALVITDRQLQSWRGDDWAREKVGAHLREHPVVFVGYSGSEPVLINTLNTVVGELRGRPPGNLFVAGPALSYGFYQVFALPSGANSTSNLVEAKGQALLTALYPMVMARYYGAEAAQAGESDWSLARENWFCPDASLLPVANDKAARLMASWLEEVATDLVAPATYPLLRSPLSTLLRSLLSNKADYVALVHKRAEFHELVRQFGLALAYNYPAPEQLRNLAGRHDGTVAPTFDLFTASRMMHVVLVPAERGGSASRRLEAEIMQYLELRRHIDRSGTYAFLCACDLEPQTAQRILAEIGASYGLGYRIQLWNRSAVYLSEGGNGNV